MLKSNESKEYPNQNKKMRQKYQLRKKTKYQQTKNQKYKPEKGIQLDWVTGEVTSISTETYTSDNSFKRRSLSSFKKSIIPNKSLIRALYPI